MSRVGKKEVIVPAGVKVNHSGRDFKVEGPKGKLEFKIHPRMEVKVEDKTITVKRSTNIPADRALHGLTRSLIQNMMVGVTEGYKKELEIVGVGFKAAMKGKTLNLALGYTHPIDYDIPEGVTVTTPNPTRVMVTGCDRQKVGQVAANIRSFHKPEPYKGKGVMYVGEQIRRKQGKAVG